jgi:hypothetical protein
MHALHFIAVEADNAEDAISEVDIALTHDNNSLFPWSDWAEIGGRWEDEGEVHCYADDPTKFEGFLERARLNRVNEIKFLLSNIDPEAIIEQVRNYNGESTGYDVALYRLRQAIAIAEGNGKHNAYFYDLKEWCEDFGGLRKRMETDPTRQFLVLVDFHH